MSERFLQALNARRVLIMDGAMGTQLQSAGLPAGCCGESWNLEHPDRVRAVHKAYVDAGAEVLLTNTFQVHPAALAASGVSSPAERVIREGLRLAREACSKQHFVLVSIGPFGPRDSEEVLDRDVLKSLAPALRSADGVLFETWSDPTCLELATALRREDPALAVQTMLLSLTYQRMNASYEGEVYRSLDGRHTPEWFAGQAKAAGFAALGVNCGRELGMMDCARILHCYRGQTDLPLFARPNAGTPVRQHGTWVYPRTPAAMAAELPDVLAAGASMIGGCCGTTPAHIAAFKRILDARSGPTADDRA